MSGNALPKSLLDNPALGGWLDFTAPGRVGLRTGKVEIGQDIHAALVRIVADELDIDPGRIDVLQVDTDRSPDEGFTAGSMSVQQSGTALRFAAAQALAALSAAAAARLDAARERVSVRDGRFLVDGLDSGETYWTLAPMIDWRQRVTGETPAKPVPQHRHVGRVGHRSGAVERCLRGGFIHDMELEGMLHARVARQPFRIARLAAVDEITLKRRCPGLTIVRRNDFLAFVGDDEFALHRLHADLAAAVRWDDAGGRWQPPGILCEETIRSTKSSTTDFSFDLDARYSRQPIAHGSIGSSCALALFDGGRLKVWTHSQGVFALRAVLARTLDLAEPAIRVVHVSGAGCYGHNGADDAALDAAIIACELPGKPVRVQWSRQDELARGPIGPAMRTRVRAALGGDGRLSRWQMTVESAPHAQRPGTGGYANLGSAEALDPGVVPSSIADLPEAAGGGASRNSVAIYDFPVQEVRVTLDAKSRVRTSSLRSLGAHVNILAIEGAMDELAAMATIDPLQFRLRHLNDRRGRAVLEKVASMCGWPGLHEPGSGRGRGLGFARYKNRGAWLAAVADVTVEEEVRVERLFVCVDAGLVVNPEGARNQITGGAIQATSWTTREAVPIENDRVPPLDWDDYPILRFSEAPEIETAFIVDENEPPLGTGEAAQGPVSAAIANAASQALGMRLRDLPLSRDRLIARMMEA